ncbi:MAG: hypothetical protein NC548_05365 [Lachnospiraceae bacterium]|nr:hypothetical protein [Lachnospiraceae bacterium]
MDQETKIQAEAETDKTANTDTENSANGITPVVINGQTLDHIDADGIWWDTEGKDMTPPRGTPTAPKRWLHISHLDLDGYSSTILSEMLTKYVPEGYLYLETANILPNRLNRMVAEAIENLDSWDNIIITDLSINQELYDMILNCKQPDKFRIFDHHECTLTDLPWFIQITDQSPLSEGQLTCATELYYNFILHDPIYALIEVSGNPSAMRYFVECVRVYDTYDFWPTRNAPANEQVMEHVDAPRLNTLFHILEREDFKKYIYTYLGTPPTKDGNPPYNLTQSSKDYPYISAILALEIAKNARYVETALRRLIKTPFNCDIYRDGKIHHLNYNIGVVFAEKNGPIIGNTACENNSDIDFCAVVSNNQISIYTNRKDLNVSQIAKLFGGGGHADAAGLTIPYINANVYNLAHFFSIIECAGRMTPGQFEGLLSDPTDTN